MRKLVRVMVIAVLGAAGFVTGVATRMYASGAAMACGADGACGGE